LKIQESRGVEGRQMQDTNRNNERGNLWSKEIGKKSMAVGKGEFVF